MAGPLAGIKMLDFTRYQQGPSATVMLAELGAEVVKVEPPGGDPGRMLSRFEDGFASYFEVLNRGKQSIIIDLRQPAMFLHTADKYPRLIHQPLQGQKGIYEKAIMAS